jgi:hypothetical protein
MSGAGDVWERGVVHVRFWEEKPEDEITTSKT